MRQDEELYTTPMPAYENEAENLYCKRLSEKSVKKIGQARRGHPCCLAVLEKGGERSEV